MEQSLELLGQEISAIEQSCGDIRRVVDTCYGGVEDSDTISDYADKIARHMVDTPSVHTISLTPRTTADGIAIRDGIAYVSKVIGNTITYGSSKINCKAEAILSQGPDLGDDQYLLQIGIMSLHDSLGKSIFPFGLAKYGTVADEIDFEHSVAIKRVNVNSSGTPIAAYVSPVEYPIPRIKPFFRVWDGGSESIRLPAGTIQSAPLTAVIGYREVASASDVLAMLYEASH